MNTLFTILTILIVIAAILLIAVVLLQSGKGEGMASNFTSANQTLGVRQTADILSQSSIRAAPNHGQVLITPANSSIVNDLRFLAPSIALPLGHAGVEHVLDQLLHYLLAEGGLHGIQGISRVII